MTTSELACVYSALILHDAELAITVSQHPYPYLYGLMASYFLSFNRETKSLLSLKQLVSTVNQFGHHCLLELLRVCSSCPAWCIINNDICIVSGKDIGSLISNVGSGVATASGTAAGTDEGKADDKAEEKKEAKKEESEEESDDDMGFGMSLC